MPLTKEDIERITQELAGLMPEAPPDDGHEEEVSVIPEPPVEEQPKEELPGVEVALEVETGPDGEEQVTVRPLQPKRIRLRRLKECEEIVALQRKWQLSYPDIDMPEDVQGLRAVIPSGLSRTELKQFLHGALEEAKVTFLRLFNTSWTKPQFYERIAEAGVSKGLDAFDRFTRKELERAIRFLSD